MSADAGTSRSSRQLSVMHVVTRLPVGGPASHLLAIAANTDPTSIRLTVVTGRLEPGEQEPEAMLEPSRLHLVRVPSLGRPPSWADVQALAELMRLMRAIRPDVVHTHTSKAGALGRIAARLARVPVVVHTFHGHVFEGYFSRGSAAGILLAERILGRSCDALIALSEDEKSELTRRYRIAPCERFRVVPPGLELGRFVAAGAQRQQARGRMGLGPTECVVSVVARLVAVKQVDRVLSACAQIEPRPRILVAGDGPDRRRLSARVHDLGMSGRVTFLGSVEDVATVYAASDVVVLASRNEGLPSVLIEALASGTPVVATRVGGIPSLLADGGGVTVPVDDTRALGAAIASLLADPARRRLAGASGQASVLRRFSAHRLCADLDRLYRELLSGRL